jgi:hypothetical protein
MAVMGCAPCLSFGGLDPPLKASNHWCFQARAKMIEIGIISIIVLAVGYWVTLWLMGRHDDVLHGDFVHGEPGDETAVLPDQPFPARPPFPAKPVFPAKPEVKAAAVKSAMVKPAAAKPVAKALPAQSASAPAAFSERSDTLQSLLASIKRDLKDASRL